MAEQPNFGSLSTDTFWASYKNRKRDRQSLTAQEMYGLTAGLTSADLQAKKQAGLIKMQTDQMNKEMAMKEEQMKLQEEAAQAQGLVNLGAIGAQSYMGYKGAVAMANALNPAAATTAATQAGAAAGGAVAQATGAAATGELAQGGAALTGSLVKATPALGEGLTTFPGAHATIAELSGATSSGAGAGASSAGLGSILQPAGLALGVGMLSSTLFAKQSDLVQGAVGALGGGIIGAAMLGSAFGGPVGFMIGAVFGAIGSLVDDVSVVCTELHRQGLLDTEMLRTSSWYVRNRLDRDVYRSYRKYSDKMVPLMKKSKIFTYMVLPFGKAMSQECAHRVHPDKYKSSRLGRAIERFLIWDAKRSKKEVVSWAV